MGSPPAEDGRDSTKKAPEALFEPSGETVLYAEIWRPRLVTIKITYTIKFRAGE